MMIIMNTVNVNSHLSVLPNITFTGQKVRRLSTSTNSKATSSSISSISSNKSKNLTSLPAAMQLCMYSDENYAYRKMRSLFSARYSNSPNVQDEFGCNLLMYTLLYRRYQLFEYLIDETSLDIDYRARDQQGNTVLHYAVLYGGNTSQVIDKLVERYRSFSIDTDERNCYGFTPLLLAVFCGRYDIALNLLTETDASPFVRDHIQLKNVFDYIETDVARKQSASHGSDSDASLLSTVELKRLRVQLYQTLSHRRDPSFLSIQQNIQKNFFETVFPRFVQDQPNALRSLILEANRFEYLSADVARLLEYLSGRYPHIKATYSQGNTTTTTTKLVFQRENSKTSIHHLLSLFDPNPRPKVLPLSGLAQGLVPTAKPSVSFKRINTKIATVSAFSRVSINKKRPSVAVASTK